jgi:hypothetical protein
MVISSKVKAGVTEGAEGDTEALTEGAAVAKVKSHRGAHFVKKGAMRSNHVFPG